MFYLWFSIKTDMWNIDEELYLCLRETERKSRVRYVSTFEPEKCLLKRDTSVITLQIKYYSTTHPTLTRTTYIHELIKKQKNFTYIHYSKICGVFMHTLNQKAIEIIELQFNRYKQTCNISNKELIKYKMDKQTIFGRWEPHAKNIYNYIYNYYLKNQQHVFFSSAVFILLPLIILISFPYQPLF